MKTGTELITIERMEQINLHGYSISEDIKTNDCKQLLHAAAELLNSEPKAIVKPYKWSFTKFKKLCLKPYKERLVIAGAFIAAEIDRLNHLYEMSAKEKAAADAGAKLREMQLSGNCIQSIRQFISVSKEMGESMEKLHNILISKL